MARAIRLGYLGFEVCDLRAWEAFAVEVLGLQVGDRGDDWMALRCDDWAQRFLLTRGESDDVSVFGWEVDDASALEEIVDRLHASGVDTQAGTDVEARRRRVERLVKLRDPAGNPCELFFGGERAATRFVSKHVLSTFVTGDQGLGHVVVSASEPERSQRFYSELLGFRPSDRIVTEVYGHPVDITFMHGGPRHHAVAIGGPQRKRVHHFMLEVSSMDEVGLAFDRAWRGGVRITQTLGRHPNDRMFSFYAKTPSGFHFEYGWGGRTVDDATWKPTTYDHISEWGHHPPEMLAPRPRAMPDRVEKTDTTEKTNERTTGSGGEVRRDR